MIWLKEECKRYLKVIETGLRHDKSAAPDSFTYLERALNLSRDQKENSKPSNTFAIYDDFAHNPKVQQIAEVMREMRKSELVRKYSLDLFLNSNVLDKAEAQIKEREEERVRRNRRARNLPNMQVKYDWADQEDTEELDNQ